MKSLFLMLVVALLVAFPFLPQGFSAVASQHGIICWQPPGSGSILCVYVGAHRCVRVRICCCPLVAEPAGKSRPFMAAPCKHLLLALWPFELEREPSPASASQQVWLLSGGLPSILKGSSSTTHTTFAPFCSQS